MSESTVQTPPDIREHLWEYEHPYHWMEGAWFQNGYHQELESWAAFMEQMGDVDDELNLLCRWDWHVDTDDNDMPVEPIGTGTLCLRYVLQRKGHCLSRDVKVRPEDEPAIREWLTKKWVVMQRLWTPFTMPPAT